MLCVTVYGYPQTLDALATFLNMPNFAHLVSKFIHSQCYSENPLYNDNIPPCPPIDPSIHIFHFAVATFLCQVTFQVSEVYIVKGYVQLSYGVQAPLGMIVFI